MKIAESTAVVRQFHKFLSLAENGESIRIRKHGRAVARLVPDADFMSGDEFAALFSNYKADDLDKAAADEVEHNIVAMKKHLREKNLAH